VPGVVAVPRERHPDRLGRDELQAYQQKALREWCQSDWLAAHDPRAYQAVEAQDADRVRIDLGGGIGESEQAPGHVVLGDTAGDVMLAARTGEHRRPDILWSIASGRLPFEDQTVDDVHLPVRVLRRLPEPAYRNLPAELARTLVVGGTVETDGEVPASFRHALDAAGFTAEGDRWTLVTQTTRLEEAAPLLRDDKVLGETRLQTLRVPHA